MVNGQFSDRNPLFIDRQTLTNQLLEGDIFGGFSVIPGQAHKKASGIGATIIGVVGVRLHWQPTNARHIKLKPDMVKIRLHRKVTA